MGRGEDGEGNARRDGEWSIVRKRAEKREERAPCPAQAEDTGLAERSGGKGGRVARHLRGDAVELRDVAGPDAIFDGAGEHEEDGTRERARGRGDDRARHALRREGSGAEEDEAG